MGQFLNRASTFFRAYGNNPAIDPDEFVRKMEFDAGISGRAPVGHTHGIGDIVGLSDDIISTCLSRFITSETIAWRHVVYFGDQLTADVVLKADGGIIADGDGLSIDFGSGTGQALPGNWRDPQAHDPVTLDASDTIDASLGGTGQELSLEVRLDPDGGLTSYNGSGIGCDFGVGTNQVARGDHTHDLLHNPVTVSNSDTIALSIGGTQLLTASARFKAPTSLAPGQGALLSDGGGAYVSLGPSGTQAAPGDHGHADATDSSSGFLSPTLYRRLQNAIDVVQIDQNILFAENDVLQGSGVGYVGGRYRFGQAMECTFLDLTAAAGTAECTLGLEINGAVIDTITIPADSGRIEVSNYAALSNTFVSANQYIRIKPLGGLDSDAVENNPSKINVTVGMRPAIADAVTIRLNAGGMAADPYSADGYFTGGITASTSTVCDTTGLSSPAPQAVYQSARRMTSQSPLIYAVTGLARGLQYSVRLHFNQFTFSAVGDEVFDIHVIGATTVDTFFFDIIDAAGGANKGWIVGCLVYPDSTGQIEVRLDPQAANHSFYGASICGLEFIPQV